MKPSDPKGWEELKNKGEQHYKTGDIEPIDLYLAGDMLRDFAIGNIIKYAYRNRESFAPVVSIKDMKKIIHYAEMIIASYVPGIPEIVTLCVPEEGPHINLKPEGFVGLRSRQ
jgi:hypothetical protein